MTLIEMNINYNPWDMLQQQPHASSGINTSFRSLLAAIDQGWLVEEPVQVMPSSRIETWTYYFVLTHPVIKQTCRLFVPATSEVERYVENNQYPVIEGSFY